MKLTSDPDIRKALRNALLRRFPPEDENCLIEEFACNDARADIAVVNGILHCFEIKSDCDGLSRLSRQARSYNEIFDQITIVVGERHLDSVSQEVPQWWGITFAHWHKTRLRLTTLRDPKQNFRTLPMSASRLLWGSEATAILRRHKFKVSNRLSTEEVWNLLASSLPEALLRSEIRSALKARVARRVAAQQTPNGGSYTIESTLPQHRRSENRRWLAAQA